MSLKCRREVHSLKMQNSYLVLYWVIIVTILEHCIYIRSPLQWHGRIKLLIVHHVKIKIIITNLIRLSSSVGLMLDYRDYSDKLGVFWENVGILIHYSNTVLRELLGLHQQATAGIILYYFVNVIFLGKYHTHYKYILHNIRPEILWMNAKYTFLKCF